MVLGGREHQLPILIVNCIEELYRTGEKISSMKPPGLTRNPRVIPTQPISNTSKPLSPPRTYQHLRLGGTTARQHHPFPTAFRTEERSHIWFWSANFPPSRIYARYLCASYNVPVFSTRTHPLAFSFPPDLGLVWVRK